MAKKEDCLVRMAKVFEGKVNSRNTAVFLIPSKKQVRIMQGGSAVVLSFKTIAEINAQCKV